MEGFLISFIITGTTILFTTLLGYCVVRYYDSHELNNLELFSL